MLTMTATVANVFRSPEGKTKDGERYGGESKVQLQGTQELRNGQRRMELFTLTVQDAGTFEKLVGKTIHISVGVFPSKNGVGYFIPSGAKPKVLGQPA